MTVTVDDNAITDCVITGDHETAEWGASRIDELPAKILEPSPLRWTACLVPPLPYGHNNGA